MVRKRSITLSQAIQGYLLFKRGARLSKHTISDYTNSFRRFQEFLVEDPPLEEIRPAQVSEFLAHLGTTPQVNDAGFAPKPAKPLSKKTLLNIHTALSSLWTWAMGEDLVTTHILHQVPRPKPEKRVIVPFTKEEVDRMLDACQYSAPYQHHRANAEQRSRNARPTGDRDEAIVRLLVDTGIRASELCHATVRDLDMQNRRLKVYGKGAKERILPMGDTTVKTVWHYLANRADASPAHPLFALSTSERKPLGRRLLYQTIKRIGDRAQVPDAKPHRFRHTFAIEYLRNEGDIYTLQRLLGHSTLDMVREYLAIAQADVERAYRKASPLDNWGI
jgi:site-specific recombinase XerD